MTTNPEALEAVARAIAATPTWDGDTFAHDLTREELYAAAQAAITAARPLIMEEAAGIAEAERFSDRLVQAQMADGSAYAETYNDACNDCAAALRAAGSETK